MLLQSALPGISTKYAKQILYRVNFFKRTLVLFGSVAMPGIITQNSNYVIGMAWLRFRPLLY